METFSTVLFIDSEPFGYTVRQTPNRIEWHPAENPARSNPPHLLAEWRNGEWLVAGTQNKDLISQIIANANQAMTPAPQHRFTAAP